jgi:hypothetical protein
VNPVDSWADVVQDILDLVGVVDPTGVVDVVNAVGYALRGKWGSAAVTALGIIPYVGDVAKAGKAGHAVALATRGARQVARGADDEYIDVYRLVSSAEKEAMEMAGYRFVASLNRRLLPSERTTRVFLRSELERMLGFAKDPSTPAGLYEYLARARVLARGFWKSVELPDVDILGTYTVNVDVLNSYLKGRIRFQRIR